jgi:3-oxoacyl-[acyl-carrier-protein] synthase III
VLTRADNIRGVRIAGVEHVIPSNKITNADVLDRLRCESGPYLSPVELDELLRLTAKGLKTAGTEVRYLREEGEIAHELCVRAGRAALAAADVSPLNVDLLLYVGVGRGFLEPATGMSSKISLASGTQPASMSWMPVEVGYARSRSPEPLSLRAVGIVRL